jgi:hypothetical protein
VPDEEMREIKDRLEAVRAIEDPAERALKAQDILRELQVDVIAAAEVRRSGVLGMRERGDSHATVARLLGIKRSAAQRIAEGRETRD